jgi:hypothetical protein
VVAVVCYAPQDVEVEDVQAEGEEVRDSAEDHEDAYG